MTATEAATRLRAVWAKHLSGMFGDRVAMTTDTLQLAREAYAASAPDEQRAAYWGFKRKGVLLADEMPTPVAARFTLGEEPDALIVDVAGWDNGQRWNGWAAPLIERDQVEIMIKALGPDEIGPRTYRLDGDVLHVVDNADDPEAREAFTVEPDLIACADGVDRMLYEVGLGLIWEIA